MMTDRQEKLNGIYEQLLTAGRCRSKKDFALLLGVSYTGLTRAMKGDEQYLTPSLLAKASAVLANPSVPAFEESEAYPRVLLLPYESRGGTIGDFVNAVHEYDCEKVVSPIKGADFAMRVAGDSMSPEYPSGSVVLIKKINEAAFIQWGEVYVLDTVNGSIIKQVRKTPDAEFIQCVSLNPAYQPFVVCCDDINGWYKVLMVMTAK